MLTKREFHGEVFYAYCQREYDEARHYLKTCGKPMNEEDRYMIEHHKTTATVFKNMLD